MEPALIQFLIGLIGGSALGCAVMRRDTKRSALPPTQTLQLATVIPYPPAEAPVKTNRQEPALAASILAIAQSPAQPLALPLKTARKSESVQASLIFHVCPACGLQAPEKLMTEHFLGSPLHRQSTGPVPIPVVSAVPVSVEETVSMAPVNDDSDRTSLGDLLQTLNVMERLLKRDFYRHELRVRSGISGRMTNIGGWIPQPLPLT